MNSSNVIYLSHELNEKTPPYGNKGGFERKSLSSINEGNTANSEYWEFNNHLGTHIDFPLHFTNNGKSLSNYSASFFLVDKIKFIPLDNIETYNIITPEHLQPFITPDPSVQAVFLRTGYGQFRTLEKYWND